jgi:hypothetical protein
VVLLGFNDQLVSLAFEKLDLAEFQIKRYWVEGKFFRIEYYWEDTVSVASSIPISKDNEPLKSAIDGIVDCIFRDLVLKSKRFSDYLSIDAEPFERAVAYALINAVFNNSYGIDNGPAYDQICVTDWMWESIADYYICVGGKAEKMTFDESNRLTHKKNSLKLIMESVRYEHNAYNKKEICAITDVCMLYSGAMDAFLKLTSGQRRIFIGGRSLQVPLDFIFEQHFDGYATKPIQNGSLKDFERRVYISQKTAMETK